MNDTENKQLQNPEEETNAIVEHVNFMWSAALLGACAYFVHRKYFKIINKSFFWWLELCWVLCWFIINTSLKILGAAYCLNICFDIIADIVMGILGAYRFNKIIKNSPVKISKQSFKKRELFCIKLYGPVLGLTIL